MQREIKFRYRIKVVETGEILTQFYTLEEIELGLLTNKNAYKFEILSRDICTDLLDKSGRDIYKEDVLDLFGNYSENKDPIYKKNLKIVEWGGEQIDEIGRNFAFGFCLPFEPKEYIIIGNIYENPELLK